MFCLLNVCVTRATWLLVRVAVGNAMVHDVGQCGKRSVGVINALGEESPVFVITIIFSVFRRELLISRVKKNL